MKSLRLFISVPVLLFTVESVFALQTETAVRDSLLRKAAASTGMEKIVVLDKISRTFWYSYPDSALHYSSLALAEAQKCRGKDCLGEAYQSLGSAHMMAGNNEKALENYNKSLEFRERDTMQIKVAHTYSNMGIIYKRYNRFDEANRYAAKAAEIGHRVGDFRFEGEMYVLISDNLVNSKRFDEGLANAEKALDAFKRINYEVGIADVDRQIGSIQLGLKNYSAAEKYLLDAYNIIVANKNNQKLEKICVLLGVLYDKLKDYPKSIEFHKKSIELATELNNMASLSAGYNNLGCIYVKSGMNEKAIDAFRKSLELSGSLKVSRKELYLNTCINLAKVYFDMGDVESATNYADVALKNLSDISNPAIIRELYQIVSAIYRTRGDYRTALKYKTLEMDYTDTVYNREKGSTTIEMLARFEAEKKEQEIELLKKEKEIKRLEIKRQNTVLFVLIITVSLLSGIILIIVMGYRVIREKNRLLALRNSELKEINATKDKLFSIVAHDLKNPFNALFGFTGMLENNYDDIREEERRDYIRMIHESSHNLFRLLDNLLEWSRSQLKSFTLSPERVSISELIKQETDLLSKNAAAKNIEVSIHADELLTVYADRNATASVLRNLISNAIKFTPPGGVVEVNAWRRNDDGEMVEIVVVDSGVGISETEMDKLFRMEGAVSKKGTSEETGTGLGLVLCHEFVEKSNGTIWAVNRQEKGSEFHFTLPAGSK